MLCLHQYLCVLLDQPRRVDVLTRTCHCMLTMHPRHVEKGTGKITSLIKNLCVHCITLYHKLASLDYDVCSDALNFF